MERRTPRAARSAVVAPAEVFDSQTGQSISAKTSDLSMGGCYLVADKVLAARTVVRIQLSHNGSRITVFGEVARCEPGKGMAIKFRGLEGSQSDILKRWLFSTDRF